VRIRTANSAIQAVIGQSRAFGRCVRTFVFCALFLGSASRLHATPIPSEQQSGSAAGYRLNASEPLPSISVWNLLHPGVEERDEPSAESLFSAPKRPLVTEPTIVAVSSFDESGDLGFDTGDEADVRSNARVLYSPSIFCPLQRSVRHSTSERSMRIEHEGCAMALASSATIRATPPPYGASDSDSNPDTGPATQLFRPPRVSISLS
jgi:hypothetical protein